MTIQSKKPLLASLGVAFLCSITMIAPAQAQYGWDDDEDDWMPRRPRAVVIEKSIVHRPGFHARELIEEPIAKRPVVERTVIVKQPIVQPVIHKTVVIQQPVVKKVIHRTVVKQPVYIKHVVRRPVHVRHTALFERSWHERPRCYLPERYLCH
jgi:hypothetical protein